MGNRVPTKFSSDAYEVLVHDVFGELLDITVRLEEEGRLSDRQTDLLIVELVRLSEEYQDELERGRRDAERRV